MTSMLKIAFVGQAALIVMVSVAGSTSGFSTANCLWKERVLQIPLLILTLIASVLSGKVENKPW